jgi:uncharacterized membrane protein (UPF0127 family)
MPDTDRRVRHGTDDHVTHLEEQTLANVRAVQLADLRKDREPRMKLLRWILPGHWSWLAWRRRAPEIRMQVKNLTRQTMLANSLEVADSGARRSKGLLGRQGLNPGEGLWILPCESVHTFGMQFSIDLVYLDRKLRIRKIRNSMPPWRISVCLSAHSVIELPVGTIRETQTSAGDTLEFSTALPSEIDRA